GHGIPGARARLARVAPRAAAAIVAAHAVGLRPVRAHPRSGVARASVMALVECRALHGVRPGAHARLTGVRPRAGVAVVACRTIRARPVRRAIVGDTIAALRRITLAGGGPADIRPLRIDGARRARPRAELGHVANARRVPTRRARREERVRRAGVVRAVAALGDVARLCCRTAHVRFLDVGRTRNVGAGAGLGRVASAGRDTTHGARRLEHVRRAVIVRPVAALGDVARTGRRAADARPLHVGRASGGRAGARLGDVAGAGGGAALGSRHLEGVARARVVRPVADLGDVTRAAGGATDRAGGLEAVGGAGVVRAIAALLGVAGAGGRAADAGLLLVAGAGRHRPAADLGHVARARGRTALGARSLEAVYGTRVVRAVAGLGDVA